MDRSGFDGRPRRKKLTRDQVIMVRAKYAADMATQAELAEEFGVSPAAIWSVVTRRTWKNADPGRKRQDAALVPADEVRALREQAAKDGMPTEDAMEHAVRLGVATTAIYDIVDHKVREECGGPPKRVFTAEERREMRRKLSDEDIYTIRETAGSGSLTVWEMAKKYEVRPQTILSVLLGVTWEDKPGMIYRLVSPTGQEVELGYPQTRTNRRGSRYDRKMLFIGDEHAEDRQLH